MRERSTGDPPDGDGDRVDGDGDRDGEVHPGSIGKNKLVLFLIPPTPPVPFESRFRPGHTGEERAGVTSG